MGNNTAKNKENSPASLVEHMSAVLDDEAGVFEQNRVLNELNSNEDLRQKLSTYSLIGESMRSGQSAITTDSSFLTGIHSEIALDEQYDQVTLDLVSNDNNKKDKAVSNNSWLRPVGGFALAASIAAVAVIGFQNFQAYQQESNVTIAAIQAELKPNLTKVAIKPKDRLTEAEMASAIVISADKMTEAQMVSAPTKYRQADKRTRSLLKHYVDSHMRHASISAFASSVSVVAFAN